MRRRQRRGQRGEGSGGSCRTGPSRLRDLADRRRLTPALVARSLAICTIGYSAVAGRRGGRHGCSGKLHARERIAGAVRYNSRASQLSVLEGCKGEAGRRAGGGFGGAALAWRYARDACRPIDWRRTLAVSSGATSPPGALCVPECFPTLTPCSVLPSMTVGIIPVSSDDMLRHARQRCQHRP